MRCDKTDKYQGHHPKQGTNKQQTADLQENISINCIEFQVQNCQQDIK